MQLEINSRRFSLYDEAREKIVEKLEKLPRYCTTDPVSVRMTLTNEGDRFTADLSFHLKEQDFHATGEHTIPEGAASIACENVERQLRRYKDRVKDHRARAEGGGLGQSLPQDDSGPGGAVVEDEFRLVDMAVSEAIDKLRDAELSFYVFRNSENGTVSVVYDKEDGDYGLIQSAP